MSRPSDAGGGEYPPGGQEAQVRGGGGVFQLDSKGDDVAPPVTKKKKMLQKGPILASTRKFDSKLNKREVLAVKKLQQQPQTPE
ncbi:hypothetical protein BBJ29_008562 [Phytophthora kernoviae]|uniref:Uncharacterized protein n=1 Tax=Phytophthora kernoviae TaxID=325452 RepID=A0A3F2RIT0_9STRA|nr:hypothetical protein BBJ29_008562 [Phytophthora kernoviae]RLN57978.1 hypothetical protein BBP00_00007240 [Phytophthora kernoviae]